MNYNDICDAILLETGQWIAGLEPTMLNKSQMDLLIKRELAQYSRYYPKITRVTRHISDTYEFTLQVDKVIPDQIISVRRPKDFKHSLFFGVNPGSVPYSRWKYNKPVLTVYSVPDLYHIEFSSPHVYENNEILSISEIDTVFLNMVQAKFMMAVGRSRRMFVLSDLPFQMDAESMYSEGKEMYDNLMEFIKTNSSFHLAIRP